MKAPIPRPDYSRAGANRDRPGVLPIEGPVLRRALDKSGIPTDAELAAVQADADQAIADAAIASGDAAAVATDLATHEAAGDPHPNYRLETDPHTLLLESGASTELELGAIADGQVLKRDGTEIVGVNIAGAGEQTFLASSFTLATGEFRVYADNIELASTDETTLEGTAVLAVL